LDSKNPPERGGRRSISPVPLRHDLLSPGYSSSLAHNTGLICFLKKNILGCFVNPQEIFDRVFLRYPYDMIYLVLGPGTLLRSHLLARSFVFSKNHFRLFCQSTRRRKIRYNDFEINDWSQEHQSCTRRRQEVCVVVATVKS
jgi:hypothetical protein